MPITMPRSGEEAGHWAAGLNSAAAYIANRPAIAAMARERAAQMQMMTARGQQYQTQAALLAQKMNDLQATDQEREALKGLAQQAASAVQNGDLKNPVIAQFRAALTSIAARQPNHPAGEALKAMGMLDQDKQYAADTRAKATTDSATIRADALKENAKTSAANKLAVAGLNRYRAVNAGGAIYDPQTGQIMVKNPSANAGNVANLMDTVTEKVEKEAPVDAVPADPGSSGLLGLGLIGVRPPTPAKPAVPGHGEITITRKVPRGTSLDKIVNGTGVNVRADAPPATPADVPPADAPPATAPAAAAPARPTYPDGTVLRHKQSGQQFVIKGGQMVPLQQMAEAPQPDSGD